MKMKQKGGSVRIIVIIVAAACFAVEAPAQSVADLARQERARKAGAEAKIKVTNDTLTVSQTAQPPAETKPVAAESPKPVAPAAVKATGPTDSKGRDEKWWRAAFTDARAELKRSEDQIKLLQLKLNQSHLDYLQKSDLYSRELRLAAEMNALNAEMDAEQRKAENAQKKIEDLEEELRHSGGLPGWAR